MLTESPRHETDWTAIYERLQSGEYEVAARRLLDMQIASLQIGDSTSAAVAAAAARSAWPWSLIERRSNGTNLPRAMQSCASAR